MVKVPYPVLMRIVFRENYQREICTEVQIYMALENIAQNFFAICFLNFHSDAVAIDRKCKVELLTDLRRQLKLKNGRAELNDAFFECSIEIRGKLPLICRRVCDAKIELDSGEAAEQRG